MTALNHHDRIVVNALKEIKSALCSTDTDVRLGWIEKLARRYRCRDISAGIAELRAAIRSGMVAADIERAAVLFPEVRRLRSHNFGPPARNAECLRRDGVARVHEPDPEPRDFQALLLTLKFIAGAQRIIEALPALAELAEALYMQAPCIACGRASTGPVRRDLCVACYSAWVRAGGPLDIDAWISKRVAKLSAAAERVAA